MRNIIVLGGSSVSGLVNRLAAELAAKDCQVIIAEGPEQAAQIAEKLGAEDAVAKAKAAEEERDGRELLVIGCGALGSGLRDLALDFDRFTVAPECFIERPTPSPTYSPYWLQGNQKFERQQQGMKAKMRRR